jgi:replicative DNA helicase
MSSAETKLYSQNIEQAILSSIIFDESLAERIVGVMNDDDFYIPGHKQIFGVMKELAASELPIDESFIQPRLKALTKDWEMI